MHYWRNLFCSVRLDRWKHSAHWVCWLNLCLGAPPRFLTKRFFLFSTASCKVYHLYYTTIPDTILLCIMLGWIFNPTSCYLCVLQKEKRKWKEGPHETTNTLETLALAYQSNTTERDECVCYFCLVFISLLFFHS